VDRIEQLTKNHDEKIRGVVDPKEENEYTNNIESMNKEFLKHWESLPGYKFSDDDKGFKPGTKIMMAL
jgi:hypothetical protein